MSVRCITAVLDHSQHAGTELLMMVVLADYSDDDGNSYPSVAALARKCRMSPRNANYILSALQVSGELRVLKNEGPNGTNRYRVMLTKLTGKPLQSAAPLKRAAPLKPASDTPAMGFPKPLKPASDKPSLNRQEPSVVARKRAAGSFDASLIELPEWLPRELWASWVADRRERRKPVTQRAADAQIKALERYRAAGHEPADVIAHSIASGYQGLYAPRSAVRAAGQPVLDSDDIFAGAK